MQLDELVAEGLDHLPAGQGLQVQAELQRVGGVEQGGQPAGGDGARVGGHGQGARVVAVDPHVVTGDLHRPGGDEVGHVARAGRSAGRLPRGLPRRQHSPSGRARAPSSPGPRLLPLGPEDRSRCCGVSAVEVHRGGGGLGAGGGGPPTTGAV